MALNMPRISAFTPFVLSCVLVLSVCVRRLACLTCMTRRRESKAASKAGLLFSIWAFDPEALKWGTAASLAVYSIGWHTQETVSC